MMRLRVMSRNGILGSRWSGRALCPKLFLLLLSGRVVISWTWLVILEILVPRRPILVTIVGLMKSLEPWTRRIWSRILRSVHILLGGCLKSMMIWIRSLRFIIRVIVVRN